MRYIDTKPNSELIYDCLASPPHIFTWVEQQNPVLEGSLETHTKRYMETYKNVSQDIRDQLNAEAKAVQIILTGIDNDIYSTFDACPNTYHNKLRCKAIINSHQPIYDQEPSMVTEDDEMSNEKEIDKLMALISLSFKKNYKRTNYNLITSSITSRENQDNTPRINKGTGDYTDDEPDDQELEAHYLYMAQIQEDEHDIIINSLDMSHDSEQDDQDDNHDLAKERELLVSLIEKLKCEK
nr:hypothetical protein [Tanacetum cinerariifolium]